MPDRLSTERDVEPETVFRGIRVTYIIFVVTVLVLGGVIIFLIIYEPSFLIDLWSPPDLDILVLRFGFQFFTAVDLFLIWLFRAKLLRPGYLRRSTRPLAVILNRHAFMFGSASSIAVIWFIFFLVFGLTADVIFMFLLALAILFWLRPKKEALQALVQQVLGP